MFETGTPARRKHHMALEKDDVLLELGLQSSKKSRAASWARSGFA
jgi:hypothetical protein